MPKIIQLDPHLANLIAAGEVVERPASVVKELLENSIDAGARTVTVEIQNGGMTLLRVRDDGCGMSREDAKLAFLRHATSKLRRKEDLEAIGTLGFRGEALAATAAVSRIDLLTRTADEDEGTRLHLEAGKLLECEPAGCPVGTNIVVRDLFYNTPARMKFMKRDSVEASAVAGAVQKQALAHPEISFRLIRDGEQQLQTSGDGELLSAVFAVLGRQAANEMIPVESAWEGVSVSGFVSKPTATRGTRNYQHFFVNHRYIKSRTLTAALEEAYRNQIMVGRFPSCVLNITLPYGAVDVNVHPAKTEVKFLREREVFDCVHYGVKGALNREPGRVEFAEAGNRQQATGNREREDGGAVGAVIGRPHEAPGEAFPLGGRRPEGPDEGRPAPAPAPGAAHPGPKPDFFRTMTAEEYRASGGNAPGTAGKAPSKSRPPVHTMTRWEYEQMTKALQKGPKPAPSQTLLEQLGKTPALHSDVRLPTDEEAGLEGSGIKDQGSGADAGDGSPGPEAAGNRQQATGDEGTAGAHSVRQPESPVTSHQSAGDGGTDLSTPLSAPLKMTQNDGEAQLPLPEVEKAPAFRYVGEVLKTYIVVEQNGEVVFIDKHAAHERINFERLRAQGDTILSQTLLLPRTCRLDKVEAALLLENRPLLQSLGWDLDDLGEGDLLVRALPSDIRESDAEATLSELAGHLQDGKLDTPQALRDEALHTIACKAAIKAGWVTDPVELEKLAAQVLSRDDLKYCPHGRPICVVLTKKMLEKQFKRIL